MSAYYNEFDHYAAEWLKNLIAAGHIAPGDVDTRSIEDVAPDDLRGYRQCHFFAGIGGWSYALRLAGWPDDREVWTGSCPCQPFSAAGKGGGFADERHLWPAWLHLIGERRPGTVFGEQVASKDGLGWLDLVQADLEGEGYACGPVDLCAAGVGAPHIRQRLWFVGHHHHHQRRDERSGRPPGRRPEPSDGSSTRSVALADHALGWPDAAGRHDGHGADAGRAQGAGDAEGRGVAGRLAYSSTGLEGGDARSLGRERQAAERGGEADPLAHHHHRGQLGQPGLRLQRPDVHDADRCGPLGGSWSAADWIACRDGKWRPVESGTFPLAHGAPARVGRLRAYGNAIVAQAAAEVIRAYEEARLFL